MPSGSSNLKVLVWFLIPILSTMIGCDRVAESEFEIDFEKYTLPNGLEVVLHQDRSDPVVAVEVFYHVGGSRDVPGLTGLAHLFEHMMFQESQHVSDGGSKVRQAGGRRTGGGGGSNEGATGYLTVVPRNALEMVLWLESDRMGFLRPAITQESFASQQSVVRNEMRQRGSNRPYGYSREVIRETLYPEDHPYHSGGGGSMKDVTLATLRDAHDFHEKWYRPNNATLVVAGDFEPEETKAWIEKYFGEIESGPEIEDLPPQPVALDTVRMAYYLDNFANSPELNVVFPTVERYHPDSYALTYLAELLSSGKKAPLYNVIVEERGLAPSVSGTHTSYEIAGEFHIQIRSFPDVDLDDVRAALEESFRRFETQSFTRADVEGIRASIETDFYRGTSRLDRRALYLAEYNEFAGLSFANIPSGLVEPSFR